VVKFEQHRICLAAINTRVAAQVFKDAFNQLSLRGAAAPGDVGHMARLVFDVPVFLYDPLAIFTLGVQAVAACLVEVEIRHTL
jgi:hypothetical protein